MWGFLVGSYAALAGTPFRVARAPKALAQVSLRRARGCMGAGAMERPPRPPLRSLSSRALSESNVPCEPDDAAKPPERSNSQRTESEALHAALLRHRTLELQSKLRAGSPLGTAAGPPASPADLLPLPSSLPGGISRPAAARAEAATKWVPPPSGTRGSAALSPEEELRGCLCGGAGESHKVRTFTVIDWLDLWGSQARSAFVQAGTAIWGGGKGNAGDAGASNAAGASTQPGPPVLVPMVVMAQ